ncbi:MAG: ATP-binding protein [Methanomicrobia archaeon]|nr:ATP-binding protein [Methanomicrobia archaeon]
MEKKLIVLSGIPGSGKSTYAQNYLNKHRNTFIVASDQIRRELFGRVDDFSQEDVVWKKFESLIREKAQTYDTIIADSSATTNVRRLRWATIFRDTFDIIELVYFDIPFAVCLKRNEERHLTIPYDDMVVMKESFETPSPEVIEAYDKIIKIKE